MSSGAIMQARHHAELCQQVEECAPAVSSPYLAAAIERCKLDVTVRYVIRGSLERWSISWPTGDRPLESWHYAADDAAESAAVYLGACATLSPPAVSPDAAHDSLPVGGVTASDEFAPEPSEAFSSQSGAPSPDDVLAPESSSTPAPGLSQAPALLSSEAPSC